MSQSVAADAEKQKVLLWRMPLMQRPLCEVQVNRWGLGNLSFLWTSEINLWECFNAFQELLFSLRSFFLQSKLVILLTATFCAVPWFFALLPVFSLSPC